MTTPDWPDASLRPVLACGAVLGAFCGLVGTFAVARRESLQGDTVAHAALPGLGLALLFGFRSESAFPGRRGRVGLAGSLGGAGRRLAAPHHARRGAGRGGWRCSSASAWC